MSFNNFLNGLFIIAAIILAYFSVIYLAPFFASWIAALKFLTAVICIHYLLLFVTALFMID